MKDRWAVAGKRTCILLYFWGLLVMLLAGPTPCAIAADAGGVNLLAIQKAKNALLEAELNRLRRGLTADPCGMDRYLGPDLSSAPVARQPPVPPGSASVGQPVSTMGELLEQATVFVIVPSDGGVSMGTGFFIGHGTILTNRHVVESHTGRILVINQRLGRAVPAKLLAISNNAARDYALLSVDAAAIPGVTALRFSTNARRTDKISTWGYPISVSASDPRFNALVTGDLTAAPEVVYSEGVISVILDQVPPVIMHSAMISQGNSGGPLVDQHGDVLGINTQISLDKDSYRQMGISLAARDILNFLQDNGVTPISAPAAR